MEHKVLPLGLEPGDEQVHHQHAEHTDEGDALETQIEEARRQCEMDDPPPTFFKEGVIEDHQPEPEGQVVDFQRLDGRIGVHAAGFGKGDEAGDELAQAVGPEAVEHQNADIGDAHAVEGVVDGFAAEQIHRCAHRGKRDHVVEDGGTPAGHVVQLLEIQRPDKHGPRRHHHKGNEKDDVIFLDEGQSVEVSGDEQKTGGQADHGGLHQVLHEPGQAHAAVPEPDAHHGNVEQRQPERPLRRFPLQELCSSMLRKILPVSAAISPKE